MVKVYHFCILVFPLYLQFSCGTAPDVLTGLDRINEYQELFHGKRIGIVTNHTAYNSKNEYITDIIQRIPDSKIVALFSQEHGISGEVAAGAGMDDQTGLTWRSPSPNMPNLQVATVYPGICLFEGTNISESRGTYQPFLRIGAPWFKKDDFIAINKVIKLPGVFLGPITFTPISIPAISPSPKYQDKLLTGISLSVTDRKLFRPYISGIMLVQYFYRLNSGSFEWREKHFDRLCGTSKVRQFIIEGRDIDEIKNWIDKDIQNFQETRNKYLLY